MVTVNTDTCDKCKKRNPVAYRIEPEEAWKVVVLNPVEEGLPGLFR